jgi:hypothetical protein
LGQKVLFPDDIHFHKKNFKSLIDLVETNEIEAIFITEHNNLKSLYGNYHEYKKYFLKYYDYLSKLQKEELFNETRFGAQLFLIAKAELLSYLMPQKNWSNVDISSNWQWLFNKAFRENREALLLNMAVVLFWFDFWKDVLKNNKSINLCIIFSGSLIYVKVLSYLLQNTPIRVFVVEHFFTGNDYYFEEKYTHISNNSDIKFSNIYNTLANKLILNDEVSRTKERVKAINKFLLRNNRNVKQPNSSNNTEFFENSNPIMLIIGQVINDFSIIETKMQNINSLQIYIKIIEKILKETNFNIIFKAHPWERHKVNIYKPLTKEYLNNYVSGNISKDLQKRIVIIEDYNLQQLSEISSFIVAFSSQSLLEFAFFGKKCCQIGDAFFGNKGFTNDFLNENEFIKAIIHNEIKGDLTINEYEKLIQFFTIIFQYYLVSVYDSDKTMIRKIMEQTQLVGVVSESNSIKMFSFSKKVPTNIYNEDSKIKFDNTKQAVSLKNTIIDNLVILMSSEKKIKKFRENPKKFFKESKFGIVKIIGKLYNF